MPRIGHVEEAVGVLDGMEESLHINARIVAMWSSILRSREMKEKRIKAQFACRIPIGFGSAMTFPLFSVWVWG